MEKIQQGHDLQKRLQNSKNKILTFIVVAIILVVAMHMFYVVQTMQHIMSSMSQDGGNATRHAENERLDGQDDR